MKKRNKFKIDKLYVHLMIAIVCYSCLFLTAWRDIGIYFQFKRGNTKTVTSECISISVERTNEPRKYSHFSIYTLHLRCGTNVFLYKEKADALFSSKEAIEDDFITGSSIVFTYVDRPAILENTYALVSASDGKSILLDEADGISHFAERTRTIVICLIAFYGIISLGLMVPIILRLHKKWKHCKNRKNKKRKKRAK